MEDVWIIFLSFVCVMIVSFFLGRFASWVFSSVFSVSSGAEWGAMLAENWEHHIA